MQAYFLLKRMKTDNTRQAMSNLVLGTSLSEDDASSRIASRLRRFFFFNFWALTARLFLSQKS
jgi:hypothetical protein